MKPGLDPKQFHIRNARARFERVGDLFAGVLTKPQRLEGSLERLDAWCTARGIRPNGAGRAESNTSEDDMTKFAAPIALLLGASCLPAFQPKPALNCNNQNGDQRRASFCEVREETVAAAGGVIGVDARQNGGISVKGWDRSDVLVRAQVRTSAPPMRKRATSPGR